MRRVIAIFIFIVVLTGVAGVVALPQSLPLHGTLLGKKYELNLGLPALDFTIWGWRFHKTFVLKRGLDIQGGMQVVLAADMSAIDAADRLDALESAREIIARRVDLYGVSEPLVQSSVAGDDYRIIVELAGVTDTQQALQLLGTTALLDFRLQAPTDPATSGESDTGASAEPTANPAGQLFFEDFISTGLTGRDLRRATPQFDPTTGEPLVSLEFNGEGSQKFAQITTDHTGEILAIFLDDFPVALPTIQTAIVDGRAQISGGFTVDQAKQLAIQLNAGALPAPIQILEQRTIGASLGQASVTTSLRAGMIGIGLVMLFMILYYGARGVLASLALCVYAVLTVAIYKILGVTLTVPGIAGLLLSIGMAVDANILIFERMKEELRLGKPFDRALELGFGRAWDSIKDANLATMMTAVVLVNPLNVKFLNSSGLVRGFGLTLLIGVVISLFTGVVVTRTLMRLFLRSPRGGEAV